MSGSLARILALGRILFPMLLLLSAAAALTDRAMAAAMLSGGCAVGLFCLLGGAAGRAREAHCHGEQLGEELLQSQKLASLGELSTGVAHEINNPLSIILQEAELIEAVAAEGRIQDAESRDLVADSSRQIMLQAKRCGDITHKMLDFARRRTPVTQRADINRMAEDMITLVEREYDPNSINVVRLFSPTLPKVATDPPLVRQVLLNLLNNAVQAAGEQGTVFVATDCRGPFVHVEVRDTGPGVPPELAERIFHPFFTTKPPGKGTGLGLSISQRIARQLGGDITVCSPPGEGASFTLKIPVTAKEERHATDSESSRSGR